MHTDLVYVFPTINNTDILYLKSPIALGYARLEIRVGVIGGCLDLRSKARILSRLFVSAEQGIRVMILDYWPTNGHHPMTVQCSKVLCVRVSLCEVQRSWLILVIDLVTALESQTTK